MNYLEYFGLQSEPFLRAPVARTFYKSAIHGKAVLRLLNAADTPGVFCLLGESGTGKTLLLRRLLDGLSEESARAAYIQVPPAGLDEELLARVAAIQLRFVPVDDISGLSEGVNELAEGDYNIVVVVDDAHRLSAGIRAKLSELTGVGLILAGRPDDGYPEGEHFELQPLSKDGTDAYVRFRIKMAGRSAQEVVEPEARKRIFELSGGNPARINAVGEQALTVGAMAGAERITVALVNDAAVLAGIADPDGNPIGYAAEEPAATVVAASASGGSAAAGVATEPEQTSSDDGVDGWDDAFDDSTPVPEPAADAVGEDEVPAKAEPAAEAVDDDDFSFDDLALGDDADESPAAEEGGAGDLDDVLSQLEDEEPATDASADEDELDDLLGGFDEEEVVSQPAPDDESVEDMLVGLAEGDDAKAEAKGDDDGELDDLLNDLAEEDGGESGVSDGDDDLESMLDGLSEDADEEAPAQDGDDLESLLDGLDDNDPSQPEVQAAPAAAETADESFEDMLDGLDDDLADEPSADDLDDLLSGMSDHEDPVADEAPDDDDDLDALLDTMDEGEPEEKKKGDDLEDELDSLLKGLED